MNILSDTLTFLWSGTVRPAARHLGIVAVSAVLVAAAACSADPAADPAASTAATSTTASATTVPQTSAAQQTAMPLQPSVPRPTAPVDALIGAEGHRLHLRCVGEGDTTVLLIAGFTGGAEGWATVEAALTDQARVCSYERPGTGTSDPATTTATFTTQATELHELLDTAGEPGPYVVVGHSFGGAEAVTFAAQYADEVTGLVLVDASPTTWPDAVCAVPDDGTEGAAILDSVCGSFAPTGNSERLDAVLAFAEAARISTLGSLPMAVITADHRELPADLAPSEATRLNEVWDAGQQAWVSLSTDAHLVSVSDTGHHIEIDQPAVVIDEITRLLP